VFSVMDGLALDWLARGDEESAREVVRLTVRLLASLARPRQGQPEDKGEAAAAGDDETESS
jgi:hypothetical protein